MHSKVEDVTKPKTKDFKEHETCDAYQHLVEYGK